MNILKIYYSLIFFLVSQQGFAQLSSSPPAVENNQAYLKNIEGIVALYNFTTSSNYNLAREQQNALRFSKSVYIHHNMLYANGEYDGYDTHFRLGEYNLSNETPFTVSWSFKPEAFKDFTETTLLSFGSSSRWLTLNRNRSNGYLVVNIRNGEYYQEFKNTLIEVSGWYNITMVFIPNENKVQVYLNGFLLPDIKLGNFKSDGSRESLNFSFCNFGNGSVFQGFIQKMAVFNRALSQSEIDGFYKNFIQDVPEPMVSPITDEEVNTYENFTYREASNWIYTPKCVEGDQLRNVTVICAGGRKINFGIGYKEAQKEYIILRNSFGSIGGFVFKNYEDCLKKVISLGLEDCNN